MWDNFEVTILVVIVAFIVYIGVMTGVTMVNAVPVCSEQGLEATWRLLFELSCVTKEIYIPLY